MDYKAILTLEMTVEDIKDDLDETLSEEANREIIDSQVKKLVYQYLNAKLIQLDSKFVE